MHTLHVYLPVKTALNLDDADLAAFGVTHIFVDSLEGGDRVEVTLDVDDEHDDRTLVTYLHSI